MSSIHSFINTIENTLDPTQREAFSKMSKSYEKSRNDWLNKVIASVALTILGSCIAPLPFVLLGAALTCVSYNFYRLYDNLANFAECPTAGRHMKGLGNYDSSLVKRIALEGTFLFEGVITVRTKGDQLTIEIKDPLAS